MFGSIDNNKHRYPVCRISEVCDILNGYAFQSKKYVDTGIRVIRIANVQKGYIEDTDPQFYPSSLFDEYEKYMLFENDLLLSLTGNVGRVGLLPKEMLPAALNQRVACIRPTERINKTFLFKMMNLDSFEKDCIDNSSGSAQKNMSTEWLKRYKFILPPMYEQKKFVRISEQADKSKFMRSKSQFIEMFGSNDCESKPLSDLTSLITKGTTPTSVGFNFEEDGIKYIKAENICEDTSINLNDCMHISQDCHNTLKRSQLQNGDILFSIAGVIGRVGVITKECLPANTNQALAIIRFDTSKEINKEYAKHALLSPFVESQWKMKKRGAAQMNISLKDVGDINIPLPSLAKQEQFCQIADQADKSKYVVLRNI